MQISDLKTRLLGKDPAFWDELRVHTQAATEFDQLFLLSSLRKKAMARGVPGLASTGPRIKLAILGAYSLYPLHEFLEHLCEMAGYPCDVWLGAYDNYVAEIVDDSSALYAFAPHVVLLLPGEHRCRYTGNLTDPLDQQRDEARRVVNSLLELAGKVHAQSGAEVILANFMLPPRHDLGHFRGRTLGSDWSFRKWVNLELGLAASPFLRICDLEFLAYRHGGILARDDRAWFESKQPCSPALLVPLAHEVTHLIATLRQPAKKVLVLDLDNTLWGGVIADDGLEGIEIGDTSPRGEAFKAFQKYILSLKERGVLLAVCSKNDHAKAIEAFEKHPEMALRLTDFVSFKANWEPKSENIRQIAADLNLGRDSLVFVDDNPAEIDIVRQFVPEVTTLLLGPDPSGYVAQLQDCRLFEPQSLTSEDVLRTNQYRVESERRALQNTVTDMGAYLQSLQMEATIREFNSLDAPRVAQLINKSNQFNLTTRRRTEAEICALMNDPHYVGFSLRLKDRFGDHGLVGVVIAEWSTPTMKIDTWLMSCRVLKRQVEEETLNELARLAINLDCTELEGIYLPTAKNEMVRDFYSTIGFTRRGTTEDPRRYLLALESFHPHPTTIKVTQRAYESK